MSLDRYIEAARAAGCFQEQITRFCSAGYVALPGMLDFHAAAAEVNTRNGVTELMQEGTRGSAKSHGVIAQVGLDDCQAVPELKCLFLRQTQKAAGESFEDLVTRVLQGVKHKANTEKVTFPNGSKIVIGGFAYDKDIDKYIGIEYDVIVLEEANQISGKKRQELTGSLRTSKENWVPRLYLSTNPGGIGHEENKQRYVMPMRNGTETNTRCFHSSYKDNPFINQEYKNYLESLTGLLAKMWRDGDWDVFAGQAFAEFQPEKDGRNWHVIKPFDIPDNWQRWRGIDWGFAAPMACYWFAKDPDTRRTYIYRELYEAGLTDPQQARRINEMSGDKEIFTFTFADPSMWTKRTTGEIATSTHDTYSSNGIYLTKADNDHANKKRKLHSVLAVLPDGLPGLQIFSTCTNLIRTIPILQTDPDKPEDILDDQEDHAYDAVTYGMTNYRDPAPEPHRKKSEPWVSPMLHMKGL